jgi:hypothetical protein
MTRYEPEYFTENLSLLISKIVSNSRIIAADL